MQIPDDKPRIPLTNKYTFLVIGTLLLAITWLLWPAQSYSSIATAYAEEGRIAQHIPVFGRLRAEVERSIIPKVSGSVINKLVRPGDTVDQHTTIISLSNIKIEQEYTDAQMQVMSAEANIKELTSELLGKQRKLKNNLALATSKQSLAAVELKAKKKLYQKNIISELDLKKAELAFQQTQLEAQLAEDELNDFSDIKEAKRDVAEARLNQAKARFAVASSNKNNLKIKAGMAGIVQSLDNNIKVGQWLDSGRSLGSIAQAEKLYAEVKVMASYAAQLEKGQKVHLEIKGETVMATVNHIEPNVIDNQLQLYVVPDSLPDTARLNIEVSGRISLFDKAALVVKRPDYLENSTPNQVIWVLNEHNELERREVEVGLVTEEKIEVLSGLAPGERVALATPKEAL